MATLREEAVHELEQIEMGGAYAGLSRRLKSDSSINEGKLTDLVSGVTRWRRWLDFLVDSFLTGDPGELEPRVRILLRLGLFELLLTKTPDYAVVNEVVRTARKMVGRRVTGLINGILRTAIRQRDELPEPAGDDLADVLGIQYSHPTWMVQRWLDRYGEESTERLLKYNNQRPRFGLRLRNANRDAIRQRLKQKGVEIERSSYLDDFLRTEQLRPILQEGLIEEGEVLIQDEAAGVVVRMVGPAAGERILDACAAPGGKSVYLADLVGSTGTVVGVDRNISRLQLLDKLSKRLGIDHLSTKVADFRKLDPATVGGQFDKVLLDVPCSGLGVLSKRADLRWRKHPEEIVDLTHLQDELLESAALFVKKGGFLIYSTCTLEPEENDARVEKFLTSSKSFILDPVGDEVPDCLRTTEGYYRSIPFEHEIDGAFAARMRRI